VTANIPDEPGHDPEVPHLETRVAIAVIPLISRSVAFLDDRQTIVSDITQCWLALPEQVKAGYHKIGHPNGHGITYFGYDYVDTIEHAGDPETESGSQEWSDLVEEQQICQRWGDRLDVIRADRDNGSTPDREWLSQFPIYPEDEPVTTPNVVDAA
jgi:hypothetical protein